jgi:hypothetical protein
LALEVFPAVIGVAVLICLIGTICAPLFMSRFHDGALARLSDQSAEKRQRLGFGLR